MQGGVHAGLCVCHSGAYSYTLKGPTRRAWRNTTLTLIHGSWLEICLKHGICMAVRVFIMVFREERQRQTKDVASSPGMTAVPLK